MIPQIEDELVRRPAGPIFFTPDSGVRPTGAFDLPRNLTRHIKESLFPKGGTTYGLKALKAECRKVARTPEGSRNSGLWVSGLKVGSLIGGGELEPVMAVRQLFSAALQSGLPEQEVNLVLARADGAIMSGLRRPRNSQGDLVDQYLNAVLKRSEFNPDLVILGDLDPWVDFLQDGEPAWEVMRIHAQMSQLGLLYWSNYLYFMYRIHALALKRVPGTRVLYDELNRRFLEYASEEEIFYVEHQIGLNVVVANHPGPFFGSYGRVFDIRKAFRGEYDR